MWGISSWLLRQGAKQSVGGCNGAWSAGSCDGAESTAERKYPRPRSGNRMGKTRDLFKKIRDIKGTFHAKMGSIKDRNGMDLAEAVDIKTSWQEYTEELYKVDVHDPDNHQGVITHLEPDILECEVKWALESITMNKASGGDGIPMELFQILKDDAVKMLYSICQQIWKTAVATWKSRPFPGLEKVSFHSNPKVKQCQRMLKLSDNCTHLTC